MADEDAPPGRQPAWPPDGEAVQKALKAHEEGLEMTPFEAAVLGILVEAGEPLTSEEIARRLEASYDRPPTQDAVVARHSAWARNQPA